MLREGLKMSPDEGQEELEEVQAEIKKKDEEVMLIIPLESGQIRIHPHEPQKIREIFFKNDALLFSETDLHLFDIHTTLLYYSWIWHCVVAFYEEFCGFEVVLYNQNYLKVT